MKLNMCILAAVYLLLVLGSRSASADDFPGYPENVGTFPYFTTPSGRITCEYRAKRVGCTNYHGSARGQYEWYVKSQGRGRQHSIRGNYPVQDLPRAKYGVTYVYRTIKCRIHKTRGIKCSNKAGHGFRVSVEKQRVF